MFYFYASLKFQQVIFSQSSELLERQSSMASSMEEVSTQQDLSGDSKLDDSVTTDQQFGVFKDFDFLEYELESQEDEGMDQFNWGVHRHSLSSLNAEGEKENTAQATPSHSSRKVCFSNGLIFNWNYCFISTHEAGSRHWRIVRRRYGFCFSLGWHGSRIRA